MSNREELGKRTVKVLELTRKKADKYGNERKILDKYLRECIDDESYIKEWECYLIRFEMELNNA